MDQKEWIVVLSVSQTVTAETEDEAINIAVHAAKTAGTLYWPSVDPRPLFVNEAS